MTHDIVGEWDLNEVSKANKGKDSFLGRIAFLEQGGKIVVKDADPESTDKPSRVDIDGDTIRFEILSGRSGRGNTNHTYEITMQGPYAFGGTRRQGLLQRTPITGQRVGDLPGAAPENVPAAATSYPTGDLSSSLIAMPGSVAEAKAKAAEAAERAALAAAEAAAALAEAEAAAALEAARRAAENAAAARAAVHTEAQPMAAPAAEPPAPAPVAEAPMPMPVAPALPQSFAPPAPPAPPAAFAAPPAPPQPAQPWAFVPPVPPVEPVPTATGSLPAASVPFDPRSAIDAALEDSAAGSPAKWRLRVTHRLSSGDRTALAVEVFPGVFVWGNNFATSEQRLREVGWVATPIVTDETIEVDAQLINHAAMVRDSFAQ